MRILSIFFFFVWSLISSGEAYCKSAPLLIHSETYKFFLNKDGTGTQIVTIEMEILTPEGINILTPYTIEYDPNLKDLHIKEAYVLQPDGTKVTLQPDAIFTRPSLASTEAPGFVNTLTTSLVFPSLQVGSRIIYTVVGKIKKLGPYGFFFGGRPNFHNPQKNFLLELHAPLKEDFPLYVDQVGDLFSVQETEDPSKKERVIKISFKDWKGFTSEPNMVNPNYWLPYFIITPFKSWQEVGAIYYKENLPQNIVNDTIKDLAHSIVKEKKGEEAAKALYDWVAHNITYLSISLDPMSGIKAHSSLETLQTKYGDCKDKANLLQALLKAVDISSFPVLVNVNGGIKKAPILPYPFFDHVILYLPTYNLFVDPTNRFASLGVLSFPLYGSPALLVKKDENTLKFLPSIKPEDHLYKSISSLSFSKEGTLKGSNNIKTTGYTSTEYRSFFFRPTSTPEEIANSVLSMTPEGGAGTLESEDIFTLSPSFTFSGSWQTPKLLLLEDKSSFPVPYGLDPRLSLPYLRSLFTNSPRKYPFEVLPGVDIWEYTITPPTGYTFRSIPKNRYLETQGALYKSTYTVSENKLHITHQLKFKKSLFTPQESTQIMDPIELFLLDLRQPIFLKRQKQ